MVAVATTTGGTFVIYMDCTKYTGPIGVPVGSIRPLTGDSVSAVARGWAVVRKQPM